MKLSLFIVIVAVLACQTLAAPSDHSILKTLQSKKTATVIIDIAGSNAASVHTQFTTQSFETRAQKLNALYDTLKTHADSTQINILGVLDQEKAEKPIVVEQLWAINKIIVKNADYSLVERLLSMEEVAGVREGQMFQLTKPVDTVVHSEGMTAPQEGNWGVEGINAHLIHASGNKGGKSVIGGIDSGVRATHEALKDGLRPTHSWFDPYKGTTSPNDQDGHGTHTMGTIVGRANGIGVAPEAQWIACKGCNNAGCYEPELLSCAQWMLCPTNPEGGERDCSKAPNAVSNSWGGGHGITVFDEIIAAWTAANIAPIFAIGNGGPWCGSADSPGDSIGAIGVGSVTIDDDVSSFSARGPTFRGNRIKPDIVAPGSDIFSAYNLADDAYATFSGTSGATPHVAGLAALLYTEKENLTVPQLRSALELGAQKISKTTGYCDSLPATTYPNHFVGHGRVDAVEAIKLVKQM